MLELILAGLCAVVVGYLVLLLRSYEYLSIAELKRQARSGNKQAKAVYSVRGPYNSHVFILLWALIGIFSSTMILLIEGVLWTGFVIAITVPVTILIHAILPWSRYPEPSLSMAGFSAPTVAFILRFTSPLINPLERVVGTWISHSETHRINSKDELVDILEHTRIEGDPFSKDELSIALHAMTFGDKQITTIMTPRSVVKVVRAGDVLSPVMLADLHESGFSRFPVVESEKGDMVGTLYSKDLAGLRSSKFVRDVMRPDIFYVNEFSSLDNVLNAFLRTQHHLFIVVNEFEENVGIVTIEDVIEQIIGRKIVDEFDRYDDLRLVARQLADEEAKKREGQTV